MSLFCFCCLYFVQNQFAALNLPKKDNSQIEGPSISNTYGFKISMQNLQDAKALHEVSCTNIIYSTVHLFENSIHLYIASVTFKIVFRHFIEMGVAEQFRKVLLKTIEF